MAKIKFHLATDLYEETTEIEYTHSDLNRSYFKQMVEAVCERITFQNILDKEDLDEVNESIKVRKEN